jgi:K+-transporting ATPase, A chain
MSMIMIQCMVYLLILIGASVPLVSYIYKVMTGQKVLLSGVLSPVENGIYNVMGIRQEDEMGPKEYTLTVLLFSTIGLVFVFGLQMLQNTLPFNPEHMKAVSWDLALNTATSFVSNTNWQAYSGESTLSYFTQSIGLTVQNFVSAGTGSTILFALIRGFTFTRQTSIGNFWRDLTRSTIYILIPLSLILAVNGCSGCIG